MFPAIYKKLRKWQEESKTSVNILVTGKTGTGKSAIVNSITGTQVTEEGDTLKPQTKRIEHTIKHVGDVQLQVWDSPGLQDDTGNEEHYVREIKAKCSEFDLIVYTLRMTQSRILKNDPDCKAMQILSQENALGANMWHNVVIVLTFANIVESMAEKYKVDKSDPALIKAKVQEVFRNEFYYFVEAIHTIFIECVGLSKNLAKSIPIVPAGYLASHTVPTGSSSDPMTLPKYTGDICNGERYHWLSDLWLKALKVTKLDAQPAMIKMNENRLAESQDEYDGRLKSTIAKQMPIIFGAKGAEFGKKLFSVCTGVGTTIGTITGLGLGHILSYAVLANQGHKNKILTPEEYQQLKEKCDAGDDTFDFEVV